MSRVSQHAAHLARSGHVPAHAALGAILLLAACSSIESQSRHFGPGSEYGVPKLGLDSGCTIRHADRRPTLLRAGHYLCRSLRTSRRRSTSSKTRVSSPSATSAR